MSYQSEIYDAILASAPIAELIGDRFSWDIADPSTVAPYLVAQTIANSSNGDLQGVRDTSFPLIQITCWAISKSQAIEVMHRVEKALEGMEIPGETGISMNFSNEHSSYDSETRLFGEIREFRASINTTN